jgi:hypothetical protein
VSDSPIALSDTEKLAKATWRCRSLQERQLHMSKIVVMHPQFTKAIREIHRRAERARHQGKGGALSIVVETGGGKSTLAKFVASQRPDEHTDELTIRRCVTFCVPPRPSSGSMSAAVLKALGDPRWNIGKVDLLEARAVHLLKECRTEVVFIDNVHDVPERRARKGVREVGNWIRTLIDNVPALFVSLGAEQGLDVFKANNQARRRSPAHIRIDYFDCQTSAGVARMRRFLFEVDKQLPLAEMSGISSFDITRRIGMATYGIPDYIIGLLTEALEATVKAGRESIEVGDLLHAFNKLYEDGAAEINPFSPNAEIRVMNGKDEPFENWLEDGYE